MNDYLMIGTVLKPQGVRGECKIRSYASQIDLFTEWKTLYRKTPEGFFPLSVNVVRIRDGFVYARLDGSSTADEAERFRGWELFVDRSHAAPAEEGAVLIADLIGCKAKDPSGTVIGELTEVLQYGTVDTWVFKSGSSILMAPALKSVFTDVDPVNKTILVDPDRLEEVAVRT